MLNGALTIGTRDGATIEMAEAAGEENLFLFGLSAEQVAASRQWYNPRWHYEHEPGTRVMLDLIAAGHFSPAEPGRYRGLVEVLLDHGDYFMHLADLGAYAEAHARLGQTLADPAAWSRKGLLNIAASGGFSSDRTVSEYAARIWRVVPCTGN
jgi:starch phosphorylase